MQLSRLPSTGLAGDEELDVGIEDCSWCYVSGRRACFRSKLMIPHSCCELIVFLPLEISCGVVRRCVEVLDAPTVLDSGYQITGMILRSQTNDRQMPVNMCLPSER
jgi:hypothetical protein